MYSECAAVAICKAMLLCFQNVGFYVNNNWWNNAAKQANAMYCFVIYRVHHKKSDAQNLLVKNI